MAAFSSRSIFISSLVLGVAILSPRFPVNSRSPPNSGSLQATVPVGGQGMEILPGRHQLSTTDFYTSSNTEWLSPARADSGPCRHPYSTPRLCDNKAPYLNLATCDLVAHSGDRPSESAGCQCAVTCAKQGTFRLLWGRIWYSDYRRRESRHTTGPYFCAL